MEKNSKDNNKSQKFTTIDLEKQDGNSENKLNKKRFTLTDFLENDMSNTKKKIQKIEPDTNFLNNKPFSKKYYEILSKRKELPAWDAKEKLFKLIKDSQILILQGETGSGKTTQIPQFLLEGGY